MIKVKRKVQNRKVMARNIVPNQNISTKRKLIGYPVIAMMTGQTDTTMIKHQRITNFDTDADQIGVDNRCSACITHRIEDLWVIPSKPSEQ